MSIKKLVIWVIMVLNYMYISHPGKHRNKFVLLTNENTKNVLEMINIIFIDRYLDKYSESYLVTAGRCHVLVRNSVLVSTYIYNDLCISIK